MIIEFTVENKRHSIEMPADCRLTITLDADKEKDMSEVGIERLASWPVEIHVLKKHNRHGHCKAVFIIQTREINNLPSLELVTHVNSKNRHKHITGKYIKKRGD